MKPHNKRICIVLNPKESTRTKQPPQVKTLFTCASLKNKELLQGIAYSDGTYKVGYDCWRILNKMDFCSYPVKTYDSKEKLEKDITVIQDRPKAFYLPGKEKIC